MKIKYKDKIYKVVRETPKMYYISETKRVRKDSCEIVNDAEKSEKNEKITMAINKSIGKNLKLDQNVKVYQDEVLVGEGLVTIIIRDNNKGNLTPGFYLNNEVDKKYRFEDVKIYKV